MMRIACTILFVLLVSVTSASALDWSETFAFAAVTIDPSGQPALVFSAQLQFDQHPQAASLSYGWTVYELTAEGAIELDSYYKSTGAVAQTFTVASRRVPIEAGKRYRGHFVAKDALNDLAHERDVDYTAPLSLPLGIRLEAASGDEVFDFSGVPDEELEVMATAYDVLETGYKVLSTGVSLDAFFSDFASSEEDFPVTIFVIPIPGAEGTLGPSTSPITFTAITFMHVYPVPGANAVAGLLEQLSVFGREFVGRAYAGEGDDALFGGVTVFVEEEAWKMLSAASEAEAQRLAP